MKADKPKITNHKHQITNRIKSKLFGILNFGICDLLFEIYYCWNLKTSFFDKMLSNKIR
jgi:hypothetical protein